MTKKNTKQKICFRCKREIEDKENYYSFIEFDRGKEVNTNYAHRKCWDDFLEQVSTLQTAQGLLKGVQGSLQRMGLVEPEKVRI